MVTLVDAKHVELHLGEDECLAQIALADLILLNKIDLRTATEVNAIEARLRGINPLAEIKHTLNATIELAELVALCQSRTDKMPDMTCDKAHHHCDDDCQHHGCLHTIAMIPDGHQCHGEHDDHKQHGASAETSEHPAHHHHDDKVKAIAFRVPGSLDRGKFNKWAQERRSEGKSIFRAKGILAIAGMEEQMIVQGVHAQWEATKGRLWGNELRESKFVLIGCDLDAQALEASFLLCVAS
jgi:G3E family GTPase